jgi:hypothetical protein
MSYRKDGRNQVDQATEAREPATLRGWLSVIPSFLENQSSVSKIEMEEHDDRKTDAHSMISHKPIWKESRLTV